MAVDYQPLPAESGLLVAAGASHQVFFHGMSARAAGGEVFLTFRAGGAGGDSFYPVHLQDGESRADPPFAEGINVPGDLWVEVVNGEFLVGGAVFVKTGS